MQETCVQSQAGKSPGEGHGNPLQYSHLGNQMDRGGWWAVVHVVAKRVGRDWTTITTTYQFVLFKFFDIGA